VYDRGKFWVDSRDPASRPGAAIGWFRRYRAADGQLYAVLLTAYFFLTLLPLLIVESNYVYKDQEELAKRLNHRLQLSGNTGHLVVTVLAGSGNHKLSAALLAIINLFFFGVGFGRVLQLVHARSWGLDLRKNAWLDQSLYYGILAVLAVVTSSTCCRRKRSADHPPGSAGCSTSPGSRCWSASSPGHRGYSCTEPSPHGTSSRVPSSRSCASSASASSPACSSATG
jgi:hypothetical protein